MSFIDFATATVRHAKPGYIAQRQTAAENGILALTPTASEAAERKAVSAPKNEAPKPQISPAQARYQLLRNIERLAQPREAIKWQAARVLRDDRMFGRVRFGQAVMQFRRADTGRILKAAAQQPNLMKAADPDLRLRHAIGLAPKPPQGTARGRYAALEHKPVFRPASMPNASLSLKQLVPEIMKHGAKAMLPPGTATALKLVTCAMRPGPASRRRLAGYDR